MNWNHYKYQLIKIGDGCFNRFLKRDIFYVSESADWVIRQVGISVTSSLKDMSSKVVMNSRGIRQSIVHFGSINTFLGLDIPHKSNRVIVTWFHVVPSDQQNILFNERKKFVSKWHTACNLTKKSLITLGIPEEKIVVIPLGVDLKVFYKPDSHEINSIRSSLGIPEGVIVIGSFQKDGNGWEEGFEPKLIKGPDIFCDAVEQLARHYKIYILLTGPARGYVKRRLDKAGIPYLHHYLNNPADVARYYRALDLYLVTSRIEGGPQAVLESMATGVPVVSTRVGLSPDIIIDGENGFLCDVENTGQIVHRSIDILKNSINRKKIVSQAVNMIKKYDWSEIAHQYQHFLYSS
ncbi:MAG: glycosyltransferase family 4 protein [Chitinivibrionales bacterium]|nr:glycosyltransferase family 4 protein [Chitinivibrionales bacterium]